MTTFGKSTFIRLPVSWPGIEEAIAERHVPELSSDDTGKRRSESPAVDRLLRNTASEKVDVVKTRSTQVRGVNQHGFDAINRGAVVSELRGAGLTGIWIQSACC